MRSHIGLFTGNSQPGRHRIAEYFSLDQPDPVSAVAAPVSFGDE